MNISITDALLLITLGILIGIMLGWWMFNNKVDI